MSKDTRTLAQMSYSSSPNEAAIGIAAINSLGIPIISVDIPSGLDCDTGQTLGISIKANCTVTFVAVKKGFSLGSARMQTGEIYVASIGVEPGFKSSG